MLIRELAKERLADNSDTGLIDGKVMIRLRPVALVSPLIIDKLLKGAKMVQSDCQVICRALLLPLSRFFQVFGHPFLCKQIYRLNVRQGKGDKRV